jgi:hypothetical protein
VVLGGTRLRESITGRWEDDGTIRLQGTLRNEILSTNGTVTLCESRYSVTYSKQ